MKHRYNLRLFLFLLFLAFAVPNAAFAEPEKFRIAVIIPLSGQVASLGTYVRKGIDLAIESLPSRERDTLEVIYEDDQFDPVQTIGAYRKLKATGKIDAVFVVGSPPANALGPITEKDKTILVAIGASDPSIAVGKTYSFIHWVIPPVLGEKLADEMMKRDFKKIAFVVADVTGAIADVDAAIDALKKRDAGERVIYRQDFIKNTTDYRSVLTKIRQEKADAVVAVLFSGALASFAKQFRELRIQADLIGMETFEDEAEVKASNNTLVGAWYVNASDSTSEFVEAYKKRYQEHPGWGTGNGYDSLKLISLAVKNVGSSSDKIRDFLRSVKDYSGATGTYSASGDNRFTLPAALKKVTQDGFESFN
jgi:branched-chain amino acid transport system substrate-binding protein